MRWTGNNSILPSPYHCFPLCLFSNLCFAIKFIYCFISVFPVTFSFFLFFSCLPFHHSAIVHFCFFVIFFFFCVIVSPVQRFISLLCMAVFNFSRFYCFILSILSYLFLLFHCLVSCFTSLHFFLFFFLATVSSVSCLLFVFILFIYVLFHLSFTFVGAGKKVI